MNKEPIEGLIDVLRSGQYSQINGFARTDDGFCAMGVAVDSGDFGVKWTRLTSGRWVIAAIDLGERIDRYYGINLKIRERIAELNDSGMSFPEIADWLEDQLA